MFLKGTGGAALALPLLPSLLPREAWGQTAGATKRYFNFVGGYDYGHHQHWYPTLNQPSQMHTPANGDFAFRYQALNTFASPSSNTNLSLILGNRLNPLVNKMNIFRALNLHTRIAHGQGHMLGNIAASDGHDTQVTTLKRLRTIDQVLATNRNFTPHTRDPLILSPESSYSYQGDTLGNISRVGGRWPKPHELFNSLFNGIPEGGGTSTTPAHPRRDILTRVMQDYQRVINGRTISANDKSILNNIMDQISDIQSRLPGSTTTSTAGCRYSNIDVNQSMTDGISAQNYNVQNQAYAYQMYARIFAAAASCDIHRVFGFHTNISSFFDRNNAEDFHQGHSHKPWDVIVENNNRINHQWMAEIWRMYVDNFVAPLALALDGINDTNGKTLLDNSLVHMTLESSTVHNDSNKPCLMIGGAGGALNTGYLIDYSRRDLGPCRMQGDNFNENPASAQFGHAYHGQHYNRSLTTVLRAMGLNPSEYEDSTINQFFRGRTDGAIGTQNNGISNVGGYGHIGSDVSGVWYYTISELRTLEYGRQNYHFYKEMLPLPPGSLA